jgi:hypothetical protein
LQRIRAINVTENVTLFGHVLTFVCFQLVHGVCNVGSGDDGVTLENAGSWIEAGVRVGDQKFRAWPMPGGKPGMFSLYAFAWNMPADTVPVAYASIGAGNDATSPLVVVFPKKEQPKYTTHDLQVSDAFMQKVIGELDPNGFQNDVCLLGQKSIQLLVKPFFELAEFRL